MGIQGTREYYLTYEKPYHEAYRKAHLHRFAAMAQVSRAVKEGRLLNPNICYICGEKEKRIVAHHENYAQPLKVVWLCDSCHKTRHSYLASTGWVDYIKPIKVEIIPNKVQPDVAKDVFDTWVDKYKFTTYETEIMRLKVSGCSLKDIGDKYSVSRQAVWDTLRRAEKKYNKQVEVA